MQQLRELGANFMQQIGSKTKLAPDDELVSCKVQLGQLRDEIMMVKTQFTQYAHQVVEASEASVTLSKTVQKFYSEANHPGRSESVNTYLKVQEDIANRAVNTFHIRVQSGLLQELTDWLELILGVDQQIEEAQRTRMVAHETQNRLASLQSELQEKKLQKGSSSFLNGFGGKNREQDMGELNDRITEAANARKSLYADYTKIRNTVSQRVKQMMNQRFVQFDRIYVQMLECQSEYFSHSALTSKKFQRSIDYYRKQFPKEDTPELDANTDFKNRHQQNGIMEDYSPENVNGNQPRQAPNKSDNHNTSSTNSTNSSVETSTTTTEASSPINNNVMTNGHKTKPKVPSNPPPSYNAHQQQRRNTHDTESNTGSSSTVSSSPTMPRQTSQSLSTPAKHKKSKQPSIHNLFEWDHPKSNPSASHTSVLDAPQEDPSDNSIFGGLFDDSNNTNNDNNNHTNNDDLDLDFKKSEINTNNNNNLNNNNNHRSANNSSASLHANKEEHHDPFGFWGTPSSAPPSTKANNARSAAHTTASSPSGDYGFLRMNTAPQTQETSSNVGLMEQMNGNFNSASYNPDQSQQEQKTSASTSANASSVKLNGKDIANVELSAAAKKRVEKAYKMKMDQHNAKQAKVVQDQKDRLKYLQMHEAELNLWEYDNTVRRNVRTLIGKLPDVLPKHLGWKPIPFSKLLNDSQLKKGYFKAIRVVHPDRAIARNDSIESIVICEILFQALEQAYKKQFN